MVWEVVSRGLENGVGNRNESLEEGFLGVCVLRIDEGRAPPLVFIHSICAQNATYDSLHCVPVKGGLGSSFAKKTSARTSEAYSPTSKIAASLL